MSRVLPILFNTDMVRAILDGRKTVTRRLIKLQSSGDWCTVLGEIAPYQPGDVLYVRETYMDYAGLNMYKADCDKYRLESLKLAGFKWSPSIHMPKEAARIWLKVTNVRVERLQDITPDDATKEGTKETFPPLARDEFRDIWNSTLKKSDLDRYGWEASPWVWVIEFERCEKPEED